MSFAVFFVENRSFLARVSRPILCILTRQKCSKSIILTIIRDCLGFVDFSNFDGVRFAFRGIPVVVFKLKTAINVDELIGLQNFEFKRSSTRQNKNSC